MSNRRPRDDHQLDAELCDLAGLDAGVCAPSSCWDHFHACYAAIAATYGITLTASDVMDAGPSGASAALLDAVECQVVVMVDGDE